MNEFLTIKLSSNPTDPIPWLVWSNSLNDVIASGELANREHLAELVDYSAQRSVIALLPSSEVLITPIQIPAGAGRQLANMLPFLMEDELTQDIDKMHFSIIKKQGDEAIVATVLHQTLADWVERFKSHGITLKKVLPDCLALPLKDGCISAMQVDNQWLLRKSDVKGAAVDEEWLELFLNSGWLQPDGDALHFDELLQESSTDEASVESLDFENPSSENFSSANISGAENNELEVMSEVIEAAQSSVEALGQSDEASESLTIYCYSDKPQQHTQLPGKWLEAPKEMLMQTLSQGAISASVNLLTGPFKAQSSWFKHWKMWRKVAVAGVIFIALLLVQQSVQVQQLEAQTQAYRTESERIFRSVFPDRQRIPTVSYLKRLMQEEESALSGGNSAGGPSLLGWVAQLPPALQKVKSVSIQSLQFDGSRQEIRLNAQSNDFQSFEILRTELAKTFSVEQGQLNKNGTVVQGSYVIKEKGAGN
ncbi:type II secretion system protein GspL [Vibrio gangliei]|uniref:type II secretion system protein GspL n=1 Tax=Vibrio gangliei TaxID=2077090 RepID=UPI000D0139FB|nr:type II secretion system protein GspL [Vibrio gangliei]